MPDCISETSSVHPRRHVMNKLSAAGLISLVFGFILVVLKAISNVADKPFDFADKTPNFLLYSDGVVENSGFLQSAIAPVMNAPLYLLCIIMGVIMLVIGGLYFK